MLKKKLCFRYQELKTTLLAKGQSIYKDLSFTTEKCKEKLNINVKAFHVGSVSL